jgi:Fe-S-cluster-containing dehydrogenase component
MALDRRAFLTQGLGGAAAAGAAMSDEAQAFPLARTTYTASPDAVGILYDSTLCIGCRACVSACKAANGAPAVIPPEYADWNQGTWDSAEDLDGRTLNVIKAYVNGTREAKDREIDGFAFVKRHCLHCIDPSCVSVCPVSAMHKDPVTGIVSNDKDACMGCRYCSYSCPFGVPQFDLTKAYGRINKCEMCGHIQAKGGIPACCDVCPTGASLFGKLTDLQKEAETRLSLASGTAYDFPRGRLGDDRPKHADAIPNYVKKVYGEKDGGGTQLRYLAGIPFERLGLPKLPEHSFASISEGVQHTIYKWFAAPMVLFAGLLALTWRSTRGHRRGEDSQSSSHSSPNA